MCEMTNTDLASLTATQARGFHRIRIGDLLITALYDGFVPITADELRGAPRAEIRRLLAEAFVPADGDLRTAVIAFLVQGNGRNVLIDVGSGDTLGPETGWLAANLAAAHTDPTDIDHVLLTHLHPDHAGGLITPDGHVVFTRATVHAAKADADHWLDPTHAAEATGLQRFVHRTAARALAPYCDTGRFVTFDHGVQAIPGVRTVNLAGHTPGHTGYLLGDGDETVLFWGDIVHSHAVQLRLPYVSTAADSDETAAIAVRRSVLQVTSSNRWWVGAAHLPFPGLGHVRRDPDRYTWVPIPYAPVEESPTRLAAASHTAQAVEPKGGQYT
jgi:glyoxylase-like metal-dependent hydrolase (beta-lactamase superfamily II)